MISDIAQTGGSVELRRAHSLLFIQKTLSGKMRRVRARHESIDCCTTERRPGITENRTDWCIRVAAKYGPIAETLVDPAFSKLTTKIDHANLRSKFELAKKRMDKNCSLRNFGWEKILIEGSIRRDGALLIS